MDEDDAVIGDDYKERELVVHMLWGECWRKIEMGKQPIRKC